MSKKFLRYPLVQLALDEVEELQKKEGRPFSRSEWEDFRFLEIMDSCIDRPEAERESLMALEILILGTPGTLWEQDPAPYLDKYGPFLHSLLCEAQQNGIDESPDSKTNKALLQCIAAHQIGAYEYYLNQVTLYMEQLNREAPALLAGEKERYRNNLKPMYHNNRFELEPPHGIDLDAPKLKELANSVLSQLRQKLGVADDTAGVPVIPPPKGPTLH